MFQEATDPAVVERLASRRRHGAVGVAPWRVAGVHEPGSSAPLRVAPPAIFAARLSRDRTWCGRAARFRPAPERRCIRPGPNSGAYSSCVPSSHSIRRHQHGFHVLTGDFNTIAPGDLLDFRKLPHRLRALVWLSGGRIRWRTIQLILDAGYVDAYRMLHGSDPGTRFRPGRRTFAWITCSFRPHTSSRIQACEIIAGSEPASASDHLPFLTQISE